LLVALNRLSHKGYPDSTGVDYIYDLAGKVQQLNDPTGTYVFAYDNMGRLIGTATQYSFLPGHVYNNLYTYDAASNRTTLQAPDGSTNTYQYDTLNRLSTLTNSLTGQFGFSGACPERSRRNALSRRKQLTRPNGVTTNYRYDSVSRLLSVLHQAGSTVLDEASYAY
jgi:YD repeat-containing protein